MVIKRALKNYTLKRRRTIEHGRSWQTKKGGREEKERREGRESGGRKGRGKEEERRSSERKKGEGERVKNKK